MGGTGDAETGCCGTFYLRLMLFGGSFEVWILSILIELFVHIIFICPYI